MKHRSVLGCQVGRLLCQELNCLVAKQQLSWGSFVLVLLVSKKRTPPDHISSSRWRWRLKRNIETAHQIKSAARSFQPLEPRIRFLALMRQQIGFDQGIDELTDGILWECNLSEHILMGDPLGVASAHEQIDHGAGRSCNALLSKDTFNPHRLVRELFQSFSYSHVATIRL